MAKIYSSISEERIAEVDLVIKPCFIAWVGQDRDRVKELHAFISLERRLTSLKHRARTALDSDREAKLIAEIAKLEPRFIEKREYVGWVVYRQVVRFNIFVTTYGLRRMTNLITFYGWLQGGSKEVDYYDFR